MHNVLKAGYGCGQTAFFRRGFLMRRMASVMHICDNPVFNAELQHPPLLTATGDRLVPGVEKIGCGYDVIRGGFAEDEGVKRPLFDLGEKVGADSAAYAAIKNLYPQAYGYGKVLAATAPSTDEVQISARTVSDLQSEISGRASLEGSYCGFSGSVEVVGSLTESRKTTSFFSQVRGRYALYKLLLDMPGGGRPFLRPELVRLIDDANGRQLDQFFDDYGGFYIAEAVIGGRLVYTSIVNTLEVESTSEIEAMAKASYKAVVGSVTGEARAKARSEASRLDENSIRILQAKGGKIPSNMGSDGAFDVWKDSIQRGPAVIDFDHTSLRPVWDLVEYVNGARREQLRLAFLDYARRKGVIYDAPNIVPVDRYQSHRVETIGRWVYSADPRFKPTADWTHHAPTFFALANAQAGTVPVYRIKRKTAQTNGHVYGLGLDTERDWTRDTVLFHAYRDKPSKTADPSGLFQGIYMYERTTPAPDDHGRYYAPDGVPVDLKNWRKRNLEFYAAVPSKAGFLRL